MKLISIPKSKYEQYRLDLMFAGYKWDPQWLDNITVGKHILLLSEDEARELEAFTERLDRETVASEIALKDNRRAIRKLNLPFSMRAGARRLKGYDQSKHIRLMRYDFHPVKGGGYAVSEVNSDVPGGLADCTLSTAMSAALFDGRYYRYRDFGTMLCEAIAAKTRAGGRIALIHCTSYSDDRQVMQFVGDRLADMGFEPIYCAADHIKFKDKNAYCILSGNEGPVDCLIRFTPLEWIPGLPGGYRGYFDCVTPSCNHAVSLFWQTKACPFAWDELEKQGVSLSAWRQFLPETTHPRKIKSLTAAHGQPIIFKPAFGRTGEGITIKAAMKEAEYKKTMRAVRLHPRRYVAQRMFDSQAIVSSEGEAYHVCLGVYTIEGRAAGFYARISNYARIDSSSIEVPVLVESEEKKPFVTIENRFAYGRKIHELWAPPQARWTNWTRPVPFIFLNEAGTGHTFIPLSKPTIFYISSAPADTAIIVDLPDNDSIEEGLELAKIGFRPVVPLNGTKAQAGADELVPMRAIEDALILGADILKDISLPLDAPPAFLIDSNRGFRKRFVDTFDNGWDIYPQDLPTAEYFKSQGITTILVRGGKTERGRLKKDLSAILYNYQKAGLQILHTDGFSEGRPIIVKKPRGALS